MLRYKNQFKSQFHVSNKSQNHRYLWPKPACSTPNQNKTKLLSTKFFTRIRSRSEDRNVALTKGSSTEHLISILMNTYKLPGVSISKFFLGSQPRVISRMVEIKSLLYFDPPAPAAASYNLS